MKHSLITVLALLAIALGPLTGIASGANLIYNGGFEGPAENGQPRYWQISTSRGTEAEAGLDSSEKHSGEQSLKISITPPGGRVIVYLDKAGASAITPGVAYEASCWIKTRNLDYNPYHEAPSFRFNFRPQRIRAGTVADLLNRLESTSDWTRLSIQAAAPEGSNQIHLDFVLTNGTVWIDDIEVKRLE